LTHNDKAFIIGMHSLCPVLDIETIEVESGQIELRTPDEFLDYIDGRINAEPIDLIDESTFGRNHYVASVSESDIGTVRLIDLN